MTVTLDIPDALAGLFQRVHPVLSRDILESFAADEYRKGILSAKEVRVLLRHESRWETEDFLSAQGVWPGITAEEAEGDSHKLSALLAG